MYAYIRIYVYTYICIQVACVLHYVSCMYPPPHMTCMYPPPHTYTGGRVRAPLCVVHVSSSSYAMHVSSSSYVYRWTRACSITCRAASHSGTPSIANSVFSKVAFAVALCISISPLCVVQRYPQWYAIEFLGREPDHAANSVFLVYVYVYVCVCVRERDPSTSLYFLYLSEYLWREMQRSISICINRSLLQC